MRVGHQMDGIITLRNRRRAPRTHVLPLTLNEIGGTSTALPSSMYRFVEAAAARPLSTARAIVPSGRHFVGRDSAASFGLIPTLAEFKMLDDTVQVVELGLKFRRLLARKNQNALRFKD